MNKRRALRLGFVPFTPDLFESRAEAPGCWTRTLQRPRCVQYWNPERPQQLRMRRLDAEGRPVGCILEVHSPSARRTLHGAARAPAHFHAADDASTCADLHTQQP